MNFHEKYVKQLEKLMYPQWYTTCFTKNCDNSAVWGHYANGHTGICLKFKTSRNEQGKMFINLYGYAGTKSSGDIYKYMPYYFREVNYSAIYPKMNFFDSLGVLSIPKRTAWYVDREGNQSIYSDSISSFTPNDQNNKHVQWGNRYDDNFKQIISTKLEDWKY